MVRGQPNARHLTNATPNCYVFQATVGRPRSCRETASMSQSKKRIPGYEAGVLLFSWPTRPLYRQQIARADLRCEGEASGFQ